MVSGINHLTLAVRDLERSFAFYTRVVGLEPIVSTSSIRMATSSKSTRAISKAGWRNCAKAPMKDWSGTFERVSG